jgi:hypothetical protein
MSVASPAVAITKPVVAPRPIARLTYRYATCLYVVAVAAQVALAGVFVFVGPQTIELHKTFAHTFLVLSSVILLSALVGRLPGPARRDALVTAGLLAIQGGLVHALVISPFIAALHPVNALLVFWWAVGTAKRAA